MTSVYCVRADGGTNTHFCVKGGYTGIGWNEIPDLTNVTSKDELYPIYKTANPTDSNFVVGQQAGQIARFRFDMQPGDYLITPAADSEWLHFGRLLPTPPYCYVATPADGCPYRHRRPVAWSSQRLKRGTLSIPFQKAMGSSLTVFAIAQEDEFFHHIGQNELASKSPVSVYDAYRVVLEQILELHDKEFEVLITHLLTALGFEGSEHTGKTGDGGVDATGELNIANLAKIKIFVQAKRYKLGTKIAASTVRQLRQAIPLGGQGAFITTADYQSQASDVAIEDGFPRIGLINGNQLVDLLVEHWEDIPTEFQERLKLRKGLVLM